MSDAHKKVGEPVVIPVRGGTVTIQEFRDDHVLIKTELAGKKAEWSSWPHRGYLRTPGREQKRVGGVLDRYQYATAGPQSEDLHPVQVTG
jgi:hypothetical protein